MAKDHFKTHHHDTNTADWNFNILFPNQSDVHKMAAEYRPALDHPGLYPAIPGEWLHATILRVGLTDDFTEDEMLRVADVLAPKLSALHMPRLTFDSWWIWSGSVVLHISPEDACTMIYDAVIESMRQTLGDERTPITPHGRFISHTALAYSRTYHDEIGLNRQLVDNPIKPATFRATSVSLIKQWPTDGHYEWEIIHDIPVGQSTEH